MIDATSGNNMNQNNVEQSDDVTQNFPGGKQQILPEEPQIPKEPIDDTMGCTSSTSSDANEESMEAKPKPDLEQQKIDKYFKNDKPGESAHRNNNNQSPKRGITDEDDMEFSKRSKPKLSIQSTSDDEYNENNPRQRQSGPITRSSTVLPKLRATFDDSDGDDSGYQSWSQRDIAEYRNNYPNIRSNRSIKDNYRFYINEMSSHPDGDFIDNIHKEWFGNYRKLEFHHGYIQWLFPLQEQGLNWSAEPLQKHEIESIKKDKKALKRILTSYKLMLDFYGFELVDEKTGEIRRSPNGAYKERFRNLNTSSHNYLRITRILKCLGEFDYEYLKFPFLERILRESIIENTLSNCLRSCKDYWIETLRSQKERRAIRQYARELIEYRNKEMTPPNSHRAIRPSSSTSAATKIERMSISENNDDNNSNQ